MSGPAAQAARGRADDGFLRRVEREAERLRRLTLALDGTGARSFWARGVQVMLGAPGVPPAEAAQTQPRAAGDGASELIRGSDMYGGPGDCDW